MQDVDIFFPYDGFSIIALKWIESVGYCEAGEAAAFLEEQLERRIATGSRSAAACS